MRFDHDVMRVHKQMRHTRDQGKRGGRARNNSRGPGVSIQRWTGVRCCRFPFMGIPDTKLTHTMPFKGWVLIGYLSMSANERGQPTATVVKSYIVSGYARDICRCFSSLPGGRNHRRGILSRKRQWLRRLYAGDHQNSCYVKEVRLKLDCDFNKRQATAFFDLVLRRGAPRRREFSY